MSLHIQNIFTDNQTDVSGFVFALVLTPKKNRKRFPAGNVTVFETEDAMFNEAKPEENLYPAKLAGPARSSEGFMLYYLVEWL